MEGDPGVASQTPSVARCQIRPTSRPLGVPHAHPPPVRRRLAPDVQVVHGVALVLCGELGPHVVEGAGYLGKVAASVRVRQRLPRWWRDSEPGVRGESLGVRSTVVGFHVVGVQTVEEFPDRPLGSEHVKGHMLTVLRNDFVFALRL